MTPFETKVLIWLLLALLSILAWIGKLGVKYLSKISESVTNMEKDMSVLANDHANLKADVKKAEERISIIESRYILNGKH